MSEEPWPRSEERRTASPWGGVPAPNQPVSGWPAGAVPQSGPGRPGEGHPGQDHPGQGYPGQAGDAQGLHGYGQERPGHGQGQPGHGPARPEYGQGRPGYGQGWPGYGQGWPGYGQGWPGYGQPGYGPAQAGYGYPGPGYPPVPAAPPRPSTAPPRLVRVEALPGTAFGVGFADIPAVMSGMAVGGLVVGIASVLVSLVVWLFGLIGADRGWGMVIAGAFAVLSGLGGAVTIVLGILARRQIRASVDEALRFTGARVAVAGLVIGAVGLGLTLLALVTTALLEFG